MRRLLSGNRKIGQRNLLLHFSGINAIGWRVVAT
jgi:hypothetical protein